jgi:hypothetical protein
MSAKLPIPIRQRAGAELGPRTVPAEAATPQAPAPLVAADASRLPSMPAEVEVESNPSPHGRQRPQPNSAHVARGLHGELRQRFPALFGGGPKPIKLRIRSTSSPARPACSHVRRCRPAAPDWKHLICSRSARRRNADLDNQPGEISAEHHKPRGRNWHAGVNCGASVSRRCARRKGHRVRSKRWRLPPGPDAAGTTPVVGAARTAAAPRP